MTIQQIYNEQKPFIERQIAEVYNNFVKYIEQNEEYTLSDDELTELFNELMIMFFKETTPEAEWERIIDLTYEK